jgi:hypothetical protein
VSFSYRIRQCFRFSTIRFVPCAFFINKQFRTCTNAFPNEFTVRSYEYCAGKHWILYWIQENKTVTYFLRSRLFTYDIMKNFNCNYIYYMSFFLCIFTLVKLISTCLSVCLYICMYLFLFLLFKKRNISNSVKKKSFFEIYEKAIRLFNF